LHRFFLLRETRHQFVHRHGAERFCEESSRFVSTFPTMRRVCLFEFKKAFLRHFSLSPLLVLSTITGAQWEQPATRGHLFLQNAKFSHCKNQLPDVTQHIQTRRKDVPTEKRLDFRD